MCRLSSGGNWKRLIDAASGIGNANRVVERDGQRLVDAQAHSEILIVPGLVCGTPVGADCRVDAAICVGARAIDRLVCTPVDQVVSGDGFAARSRGKISRIVDRPKPVEAGVSPARLYIILGSDRSCFP